jgi:hypothetical protein
MMVITIEEKVSLAFWWVVAFAITGYLFLGIVNTFAVIFH